MDRCNGEMVPPRRIAYMTTLGTFLALEILLFLLSSTNAFSITTTVNVPCGPLQRVHVRRQSDPRFATAIASRGQHTHPQPPSPISADDLFPPPFDRTAFESQNPRAISQRWIEFVRLSAPLVSSIARLWASGRLRRDDASLALSVRTTLTALGPTFVKLGQIMSVREDVLGPVWTDELAKLQDSVEPFDGREAREAAYAAFGREAFVEFGDEPVAAASVAQVHRATFDLRSTRSGGESSEEGGVAEVAVKVLRPGIAQRVAVDLAVLLRAGDILADWAPRLLPKSRVDWRALLRGLVDGLHMECDLSGEARRQETFRGNMESVEGVLVPRVYASAENVMVSEWVEGVPLRAIPATDRRLKDAQALMRNAYCRSMFVDAFFHADCHGGNLLWVPPTGGDRGGRLCILDCGLMVAIDPSSSEGLLRLTLDLAARDWSAVVDDAVALRFLPADLGDADCVKARGVARRVLGPYLDVGGGARAASAYSASALFDDVAAAASDLPVSLPPDMVLLGRAVVQLEGLALRAYPDYRLVDDILPEAARIALRGLKGRNGVGEEGGRRTTSLLYDLLYPGNANSNGTLDGNEGASLSLERFALLISTARGDGDYKPQGDPKSALSSLLSSASGSSMEDFLDLLFREVEVRDLVASEAASVVDATARDLLWKRVNDVAEVLPSLPRIRHPFNLLPGPFQTLETLAPRLSEEEQLVLLRLPDILNRVHVPSGGIIGSGSNNSPTNAWDGKKGNARFPRLNSGLIKLMEKALLRRDPNAQSLVDAMAKELRFRLQGRLEGVGIPGELAGAIANSTLLTPW